MINDPLSALIQVAGEAATLYAPGAAPVYRPADSADYVPPADGATPLVGVPLGAEIELPVGATAGFTAALRTLPAGIDADGTSLVWRGVPWTVMKYRPRYWRGRLNGVTLFLAS